MDNTQESALTSITGSPEQSNDEGLVSSSYRAYKERERALCQSWDELQGRLDSISLELRSIDTAIKVGRGKAESEAERLSRAKVRTATLKASAQTTSMQLMAVSKELDHVRGELARHEGGAYAALTPADLKQRVVKGSIPALLGERLAAARIDPKVVMFGVAQDEGLDCESWDPWGEPS